MVEGSVFKSVYFEFDQELKVILTQMFILWLLWNCWDIKEVEDKL